MIIYLIFIKILNIQILKVWFFLDKAVLLSGFVHEHWKTFFNRRKIIHFDFSLRHVKAVIWF